MSILSFELEVELTEDPYLLANLLPGVPDLFQRKLVKRLVLTAINANSKDTAFRALRDGFPAGNYAKSLTNEQLERLLAAFLEKSPHLEGALFNDQGIRLMNLDGRIAERVHRHFTDQGIPVLSVHDSYLIDYTRVGELKQVMADASEAVVGVPLPTSNQFFGLGEREGIPAYVIQDYIKWRQTARSEGYLRRLAEHERRTDAEVVPY